MGKTNKLSKQRDGPTTSTLKKRSSGEVCYDAAAEGICKKQKKLSIKHSTKFKRRLLKSNQTVTIKDDILIDTSRLSGKAQPGRAPVQNEIASPQSFSSQAFPSRSKNPHNIKKRKIMQQKGKRRVVKIKESIPLAVVMPDTASPIHIKSTSSDDEELLESKTFIRDAIKPHNEAESDVPGVCTTIFPKVLDGNIPLMVSMTDLHIGSVNANNATSKSVCDTYQDSEVKAGPLVRNDPAHENLNSLASKHKVYESNNNNTVEEQSGLDKCAPTNRLRKKHNNVTAHLIGDSVVLQLHEKKLFIIGQVHIQVLRGRIKILGYEMDSNSGSHIVSSLRGSSFLSIEPVPNIEDESSGVLPPDLQDKHAIQSLISQSKPNEVLVLLRKGDETYLDFMQNYLDYPIYVKNFKLCDSLTLFEAQNKLKCLFHPESNLGKRILQPEEWDNLATRLIREQNGYTVICGGKGVGKSTLLRYLVNRMLSKGEHSVPGVVLLDFDPGQAELTPPGCVAVSVIRQPLFGPNYTHLQHPERSIYIGQVDVSQCLGQYMEACSSIISFLKESLHLSKLPCLVNTMGFNRGVGVTIMGQLLQLLQPTRVVQIQSKRHSNNYPFLLTGSEVIRNSRSLDARSISSSLGMFSPIKKRNLNLKYDFVTVNSTAEGGSSKNENEWGMRPKMCRDAVVLSYFYQRPSAMSYSLLDDIPYGCPLESLFLCVAHEQIPADFVLAAVNGNMVGLCSVDPQTENVSYSTEPGMPGVLDKVPIAPCIGFGIVRGVDMSSKMLYVTTPLSEDMLWRVNCLVFGAVKLPTSVYTKITAPGIVPYVSSGEHTDISTQA